MALESVGETLHGPLLFSSFELSLYLDFLKIYFLPTNL